MKLTRIAGLSVSLALAMSSAVDAQVTNGTITAEQAAGSWSSYVVARGNDQRFRASTVTGNAMMMVDIVAPDCSPVVEFGLPFTTPSKQDIPSTDVPLALRIDTGDVHSLPGYSNPVAMGDPSYIVYLRTMANFTDLYAEMKNGSTLWMKETLGTQPYYFNFPLNGFDTAFQRAYQGCLAYTGASRASPARKSHAQPAKPGASVL